MRLQQAVAAARHLLAIGALVWAGAMAGAQTPDDAKNPRVEALRKCQAVAEATQRLACYDLAAAAFFTAADGGELRVVDQETVRKTRRRLFGFALPDLNIFGTGGKDDDPPLDMLETTITSARRIGPNWIITTPEGGTWEIPNVPSSFRDPRSGDKVVFKRAALGSYFIRIGKQIGIRGRRIG